MLDQDPDPSRKIRALSTLFVIGGTDRALLRRLLRHDHEAIRTWAIRLLTDAMPIDTVFSRRGGADAEWPADLDREFTDLARHDPSGLVRLVLASMLQRLPVHQRAGLAAALASRAEDATDQNIPAMIWTGLIPVAEVDPEALVSLAKACKIPTVVRLIARRLGEEIEKRPGPLNDLLEIAASKPVEFQSQVLAGMGEALTGWRKAGKPMSWDRFAEGLSKASDPALLDRVRDLNVLFGDGRAIDEVRRLALDESAPIEMRKTALKTLIESRPPDLRSVCERLVRVRFLNAVAVRGLALFDDPALGQSLAANYRMFHPSERSAAIDTLASRPVFARALLDQIAAGKIPRQDLTAFHARQIRSLGDPALSERLSQVWGEQRDTAADRQARIATLKKWLEPTVLSEANPGQGRIVFDRICASCHTLHGYGGAIGPDLTGAGRDNIDYLLENLIDPSASVSADFRMVVVAMNDGRVLNGMVRAQTDRTLTLQTQTEALVLDRGEIESLKPSPLSLMPEGQLDTLKQEEIRDLISYLMSRTQVALPGESRR